MRWLLKRWWFWAGAGFMLVAVCVGYLLIPVEKARITQENCDKIRVGWSYEQVVDLLGEEESTRGPRSMLHPTGSWCDEDDNRISVV